ncbi:MAG: cupin-like domain-containing protein [Planctomycetes bacterium]|nr:cupin-like domain-containing protein [Planctomycetota bacterium]
MSSGENGASVFSAAARWREAWGKRGLAFGAPPVPHELWGERAALAQWLDAAPDESFELMHAAARPDDEMPLLAPPHARSSLLAPEGNVPFVLRVGPLLPWVAPLADWPAAWRALLREVVGGEHAERCEVRIDLYLASPGACSRFHADPSHNVVHQVAGRRELRVFSPLDPRLIDDRSRPDVFLLRGRSPSYRAECERDAETFDLAPGTASYIPALAGHWLKNGDELSVSYTVSLRTPAEFREKHCHALNRRLASLGFAVAPFGRHPRRDAAKAALEAWLRRRHWVGDPA